MIMSGKTSKEWGDTQGFQILFFFF